MKTVFLAPFGIRPKGTVQARMLPLAVELTALGHTVVIIAPPYTNPEDSGRTELVQGIRLENLRLPPGGRAAAAPLLVWRMLAAVRREQPDLVHLFKPKGYGGLAQQLLVLGRTLGISVPPLFLDADDWEGQGGMNQLHGYAALEQRLYAAQEHWLPRRMCGVSVASRELERRYLEMGVGRQRLVYLPNCVADRPAGDGLRVRQRLGIAADAPVMLIYSRFFEFPQEQLHAVCAQICHRLPQARILVVGKGRNGEEEQLVAAAREGGFQQAVLLAGWLEPSEIPHHLAAADLAIYPFADTLLNRAKCPAKLTELLLAGLPVVADGVGQIPEYTAPENRWLLTQPDQWQEMADRCVELLADRARCHQLGHVGRTYLLDQFAWRTYAQRLHTLYQHRTTEC